MKKQDKPRKDQANRCYKIAPFSEKALNGKRYNVEKSALVKKTHDHDRRKEERKDAADLPAQRTYGFILGRFLCTAVGFLGFGRGGFLFRALAAVSHE